ncbi:MAG: AEC family transporter [Myxococcales bacterium]|nr:AEC family transporter [Myxococcales bacterium]
MLPILLNKLVPLWLLVGLGILLRRVGTLTQERCHFLLQLVIYVALPATIFRALQGVRLQWSLWVLPMAAVWIILWTWGISWLLWRRVKPAERRGVLILAPMVMNLGTFVYPFVLATYGEETLSALVFLDFANILLSASLVYLLAAWYGSARRLSAREMGGKLAKFPLFWVLLLALGVRVLGLRVPGGLWESLGWLSGLTIPLSLLAMGGLLEWQGGIWKGKVEATQLFGVMGVRFGIGLLAALLWLVLFPCPPMHRRVILLAATAPVGFTVMAYAVHERLDATWMARLVSFSLLLGLVVTPGVLFFLMLSMP